MNNIIVGMGEALWDVLPEGKKIGGAPANFSSPGSVHNPRASLPNSLGAI